MIHTGIKMTGRVRGVLLGKVLPVSGMCDICVSVCQGPAEVVFHFVKGQYFSLTIGAVMSGLDAETAKLLSLASFAGSLTARLA